MVVKEATEAFCCFTCSVDGAQAAIDAKVLNSVLELLGSPNSDVRKWASLLTGNLASHESTAPAILGVNPHLQLVGLMRRVFSFDL